jgi:sulfate adenylyltransferase subunit 2
MGRKNQRPELFDLLNGKIENGQNVRVFQFRTGPRRCVELYREQSEIPSIYFHKRKVFLRDGMIWSPLHFMYQEENEEIEEALFVLER